LADPSPVRDYYSLLGGERERERGRERDDLPIALFDEYYACASLGYTTLLRV